MDVAETAGTDLTKSNQVPQVVFSRQSATYNSQYLPLVALEILSYVVSGCFYS
jgi:hypothetical protein